MNTTRFHVPAMDCATEKEVIAHRLGREPAVKRLDFDLLERVVTVEHRDGAVEAIERALADIGMDPRRIQPATPAGGPTRLGVPIRVRGDETHLKRRESLILWIAAALALAAEILALATDHEGSPPVIALSLGAIALGGLKPFKKALTALRTLTLNINLLMAIAVVGAVAIGEWPEAAMVIVLFAVAELVEARSTDRARDAIRALMALAPDKARVLRDGAWTIVHTHDVRPDERVQVLPGERLPLDGVVRSGKSAIDQAPITGESLPVEKSPGDQVFAGTINGTGVIELVVTAAPDDTTLARIARAIRDAQGKRAPTQRFVDRFARIYTPAVMGLAILVALVPPLVVPGATWLEWTYRALVMLVIACPCALVISTPVTVVSALTRAARRGILVKGGAHLEAAHDLTLLAVDKTGTLTHGAPSLTDVVAFGDTSRESLLHLAASLEATSTHPLAQAIVAGWRREADPGATLLAVHGAESIVGRGIRGTVGGGELLTIGNHRLAEELGVCGPTVERELDRLEAQGKSVAIAWTGSRGVIGLLAVKDTVRATSIEAIRALHREGIKVAMLTGDNPTTAAAVAAEVGIDEIAADLLPEDKLAAIDRFIAEHGTVGMVGDGVNDAPALARASIGFAMGAAGSDTALETADVALMRDDLRGIPELVALSRRTRMILVANITLAIGIKAVFFALGLAGLATLWMAVFADMGASLIVAANGLRLLKGGEPEADQSTSAS